jgi:hypothetical protein
LQSFLPFVQSLNKPKNERPHSSIAFGNVQRTALLDTGAAISCISSRTLRHVPKNAFIQRIEVPPELRKVQSAGAERMIPLNIYVLDVFVPDLGQRNWPFVEFAELSSACILGDDFLIAHGATLDRKADTVKWNLSETQVQLTLTHAAWIPPRAAATVIVRAAEHERLRGLGVISSVAVTCVEGLQEFDQDNAIRMIICNPHDDVLALRKGQQVAAFAPVRQEDIASVTTALQAKPLPAATPLSAAK